MNSVSIDDNVSDWAKAEAKFKPNGLKLIADLGGFKSVFAKSFELHVIPAYISIDKEGNVLSFSSSISDFQKIISKDN